jgi:hypothetical protein
MYLYLLVSGSTDSTLTVWRLQNDKFSVLSKLQGTGIDTRTISWHFNWNEAYRTHVASDLSYSTGINNNTN